MNQHARGDLRMPSRRRLAGAVTGGIVAGLVLAVWLLIGEVATGTPSQLISMERQIAGWFGASTPAAISPASMSEEYMGTFGHLALSMLAGAAYAFFWSEGGSIVLKGLTFGMVFYAVAHAIVGPLTGLTPPIWQVPRSIFMLGCVINGFFGICTAFFTRLIDT